MIAKKNSGYDLENKRSAFFTLGLLVTGSLTLAAFTYSDPMLRADAGSDVPREQIAINFELKPEKPEVKEESFDKHEVDDSQQQSTIDAQRQVGELIKKTVGTSDPIVSGVGPDLGGLIQGPDLKKGGKIQVIDIEDVVPFPDKDASFVGGVNAMNMFISKKVVYPEASIAIGEQGKVYVSFVVEKDGSITNIEIEEPLAPRLDREAKRVVREFPNWIPGEVKMEKVRTRVRLPIKFILD